MKKTLKNKPQTTINYEMQVKSQDLVCNIFFIFLNELWEFNWQCTWVQAVETSWSMKIEV